MSNDAPVILKGQQSGYGAIQKVTIMTNDQNRAIIFADHLLQQINRLHIQVVGWLIQHQKIVWLGKDESQHQAVLLTA